MMKKWNAPKMEELNIAATANGFFDTKWETPLDILLNDSKKPQDPPTDPENEKTNTES